MAPTALSLNEGTVGSLSVTAENASGTTVAADITFSSSNSSVATVSTGGLICAGQWDAAFINCYGTNGPAGAGRVTITATSNNNITATATVYVHEKVDQVGVGLSSCTTMGQPVSIYGIAYSTSAQGCSVAAPCNITSTVGPFSFGSNDTSVVAPNVDGGLTAGIPGATTVYAGVAGVNSVGVRYLTCAIASIGVHSSTSGDSSFNLGVGGTQTLVANVYDTNGQTIAPPITWSSSANAAATVAINTTTNNLATVTAVAPGTAYITAACSYPDCNKLLPAEYSQNVNTVTVAGGTSTTVYAASTSSKMLVPISTSSNQGATAITLPYYPNSIIADPAGTTLYLGSDGGLMAINVSTGAEITYGVAATIVAISPDGSFMLLSDTAANAIYYVSLANHTIDYGYSGVTSSGAFTPDSKSVSALFGATLLTGYPASAPSPTVLPYTPTALDIMAQGGLTYITGAGLIDVRSTCNQAELQMLTANAPTLIAALPNGTGAVAADSPAIDLVSTPSILSAGCPITSPSSIAPVDLGAGAFTAQQLFVSPDSSRAWLVSNLPELLMFYIPTVTPTAIPLIGGATPTNGGITADSNEVYVGASDGTVHRIAISVASDVQQIAVGLKDPNGNLTPPNLVYVVP
jgi:hypothetical protein